MVLAFAANTARGSVSDTQYRRQQIRISRARAKYRNLPARASRDKARG
jgi:hypothetical protein